MSKNILKFILFLFLFSYDFPIKLYATLNKNIHHVTIYGTLEQLKNIINAVNLNSKDSNGNTALHLATKNGFKKKVKFLLSYEINKELKNNQGKTALSIAINSLHEIKKEISKYQYANNEESYDLFIEEYLYQKIIDLLSP